MSHGVASRGGTSPAATETAKTADGGGSVVAASSSEGVIEDQKPRLPFTGRDFGDEPDLPDAEKEGEVDTEKKDELNGKSPSESSAARVIERDHDMMIAAAAAAAAAAALGKGEESGSLILQCDAELVTPTGVASGRLLVTTRDLTFQQVKPSKGDEEITSDERTSEDPMEDHPFVPPDDDPHAKEDPGSGGIVWRWPLDSLRGVQTRRYLLRGSASRFSSWTGGLISWISRRRRSGRACTARSPAYGPNTAARSSRLETHPRRRCFAGATSPRGGAAGR